MKLSFHSWKNYKECPKKYLLKNVQKAPITVPRNDYFALYGKLTEKFFEMFSNIWRFETPYIHENVIKDKLRVLYEGVLNTSVVNWSAPFARYNKEDIFEQSFQDICTIMSSDNHNYFLNSKSEVTIRITLKDQDKITGRIDFIHKSPLGGDQVLIFDGKGTNKIGKNISKDQLYFYAALYFFHFKVLPSELGFFYYKFNSFNPIDINTDIINEFRARLSHGIKTIKADSEYKATPSPKSCKFCDYQIGCSECMAMRASRAKPSKLPELQGEGLVEFGF